MNQSGYSILLDVLNGDTQEGAEGEGILRKNHFVEGGMDKPVGELVPYLGLNHMYLGRLSRV